MKGDMCLRFIRWQCRYMYCDVSTRYIYIECWRVHIVEFESLYDDEYRDENLLSALSHIK